MIRLFRAFVASLLLLLVSSSIAFAQRIPADEPATLGHLANLFRNAITAIVTLASFASLIMLIVGGFRYLTAQGDPKSISSARSMITWAIVGLAFIIISWLILQFIAQFTGCYGLTFFRVLTRGQDPCAL